MLISDSKIFINDKSGRRESFAIDTLSSISSKDNCIYINDKLVGELICQGKLELRYVFSVIDEFIEFSRANYVHPQPGDYDFFDFNVLNEICAKYLVPVFYSDEELVNENVHLSELQRKSKVTPSFYVDDMITVKMLQMVRFCMNIPVNEHVFAICDLGINDSNALSAFVISAKGVYVKAHNERQTQYVSWKELETLTIDGMYKDGRFWKLFFDNGKSIATSCINIYVKPFGVQLINDIKASLADKNHKSMDKKLSQKLKI